MSTIIAQRERKIKHIVRRALRAILDHFLMLIWFENFFFLWLEEFQSYLGVHFHGVIGKLSRAKFGERERGGVLLQGYEDDDEATFIQVGQVLVSAKKLRELLLIAMLTLNFFSAFLY